MKNKNWKKTIWTMIMIIMTTFQFAIPVLAAGTGGGTLTGTDFLNQAVTALSYVVIAIGAGFVIWGGVNLLEGYGNDNPGAKSQGIKQFMAGGGIILIGLLVIPQLANVFPTSLT